METESGRQFDWVQLESGEWLKGEITRVDDEELLFDSDEFDDISVDWTDVASLYPAGVVTVRLEGQRIVTGKMRMVNGAITIESATGLVEVERIELIGLIPGEPTEINFWSGSASLGYSARGGNTKQSDMNIGASIERRTVLTRTKASYTGEVSTVESATTSNSHRVPAKFDYFVTSRFFVTVPSFEFFTDEFQNIGTRITVGSGVGYELMRRSWLEWDIDGGVGYQRTSYNEDTADGKDTTSDLAVTLGTKINFDLPRGIEFDNLYNLQLTVTDFDNTSHHAQSVLSFDIWGPLEFELTFIFDRIEKPKLVLGDPGDNPPATRPKSNDYRLTAGLAVDF